MAETGDKCGASISRSVQDMITAPSPATSPVTEDEIRAFLSQGRRVTSMDLVRQFGSRLRCKEDKAAFADELWRICKIRKTSAGASYVVLREGGETLDSLIAKEFFGINI